MKIERFTYYASNDPVVESPDEYRAPSRYCDSDAPEVVELATTLTRGIGQDSERARVLFEWVRDEITYRLGLHPHRASDTLLAGEGSCSNKANLLTALLRAVGIPAGFHRITVDARTYIGPLCTPRFGRFFGARSGHYYNGVFLEGLWIQADCSDDRRLCDGAGHLNPPAQLVHFDGRETALLNLAPSDILEIEDVCRPEIDDVFEKQHRSGTNIVRVGNAYIDYVRDHGKQHDCVETVHAAFWEWFEEHEPWEYEEFVGFERWLDAQARES